MSIARHHAEWLSLLEVSGPFLSMPVLLRAFPQGLDAHDPDAFRELRLAYEEWHALRNQGGLRPNPALHTGWVRFVLERALELPPQVIAEGQAISPSLKAVIAEHGETLRPDLVVNALAETPSTPSNQNESFAPPCLVRQDRLASRSAGCAWRDIKPRLLIQIYPSSQDLDRPLSDRRWKASPATRMMELLRACDARLGLATNGERWMLVASPSPREGTTGFISWYASLWLEEHITLRAFRSLLGAHRFFSVPDDETLETLLAESIADQQEVTNQLGYQVRRAVEVLIQSIDRADQDRGRTLLTGISEPRLYEAALTVMMRLVFLFSAEERKLLLLGDPLYDQHYAVSTLRAQLREAADQHGEEVLERRQDAWCRLLATFRAVHGGISHPDLKLPAYGGSLFDPDRFPFLEGRPNISRQDANLSCRTRQGSAKENQNETLASFAALREASPLPINNRTVLHLLEALQMLQVRVPGGGPAEARRLSFLALDIEQIGAVYESLLDHTAARATEPVLGLAGTKDKEPEIPLAELEAQQAKGQDALIAFLQEQTGRSESALRKAAGDKRPMTGDQHDALYVSRLRAACGNDKAFYQRVLAFAGLIRDDDFGWPVVIPSGSVYVTAGADRRSTGTHYTPRSLTEPIVQHTLEPLVYVGPAEGLPKEQWQLRTAAEILALKICDMAMGSAAFLVQADRYMAERLVEAWEEIEGGRLRDEGKVDSSLSPQPLSLRITPEGKPATGAPGETIIPADADERMTLARRLVAERCLYGVDKNPLAVEMAKLSLWLITLAKDQPFTFLDHALKCGDSLVGADEEMFQRWARGLKSSAMTLFDEQLRQQLEAARQKRRELEAFAVKDARDAERKAALLAEADAAMERIKLGCDLLIGARLLDLKPKEKDAWLNTLLLEYMAKEQPDSPQAQQAIAAAHAVRAFHWPFEFPEVFQPLTPALSQKERELYPSPAGGRGEPGKARRGEGGFSAFVGNPPFVGGKRIRETFGDNYRVALYELYPGSAGGADYCVFFFLRAYQHLTWNGTLGLIATNTIAQGDTRATGLGQIVRLRGVIYMASASTNWPGMAAVCVSVVHIIKGGYAGVKVLDNKEVLNISSLLDSETVLGPPKTLTKNLGRSFIGVFARGNGFVLTPEEAAILIQQDSLCSEVVRPFLIGENLNSNPDQSPSRWIINFQDWTLSVAGKYVGPMQLVKERVYPQRMGDEKARRIYEKMWWQFWRPRVELFRVIDPLQRVLVAAQTSKYLSISFQPKGIVYDQTTVVIATDQGADFAILNSNLHEVWVRKYSSTLETRLRYIPGDCFETFPFPLIPAQPASTRNPQSLSTLGEAYHEHRRQIMLARQEGLTKTYNRFHDPAETSADIARLRALHVEMDQAVAAAYGWTDPSTRPLVAGQALDLGHGFHETPQGVRYTISEPARREVLARLLALNHQRYEEEVRAGLHEKKGGRQKDEGGKKARGKKQAGKKQEGPTLF